MSLDYSSLVQPRGKGYSQANVESYSNYNKPIDHTPGRVAGNSRIWGDASAETQQAAINALVEASRNAGLSTRETAHVLAIARVESGFNPDAAAGTTSASGLGQFIKETGASYGLDAQNTFDLDISAKALVAHFIDNRDLAVKRGQGEEYIYKYHHDGPKKDYGGLGLSRKDVQPYIDRYENFVKEYGKEHGVEFNLPPSRPNFDRVMEGSILEREPAPIIRSGMRGDDVRELQAFLTAQGYDTQGADGIFGRNTQTALENFQREHNLNDDGVFGRNTQTELAKLAPEKEVVREAVTAEVPNQETKAGEPTVQTPETATPEAGVAGGKVSESEEKLATILASIEATNGLINELTPEERDQLRQRLDTAMIDGQSQGVTFKFSPKEQSGSTGEFLLGALGAVAAGLSNSKHKDWAIVGGVVGGLAEWGLSKLRGGASVDINGAHGPTMTVGGHQHSMDFKKVGGLDHYANSDNTLLGKLDATEDKFTIFHRNGNKLDEIGAINDFSKQNVIALQGAEATRNLEPSKAVQAQAQTV